MIEARAVLTLYVVGWGRVGSALATQAAAAGVRLAGVDTRDAKKRRAIRKLVARPADVGTAQLVALAAPDGSVANVAAALAPRLKRGQVVFHCSGTLSLEPLAAIAASGALPASLHPYCSVASAATPLRDATCALDGTPKAVALLRRLAKAVGLRPLAKAPRDRVRYHLSAVLQVASAGVAAIAATEQLTAAGASPAEARRALAAILRSVAFNLERDNPAAALTGPFARGDLARIGLQLEALAGHPDALELYRAVGRYSAQLSPRLTAEQRNGVRSLLTPTP